MQFAVFVDGAAVHGTVAEQRGQIDFEKLRSIYLDRGDGLAVFNYFNVAVVEDNGSILMRPLLDRLDYIGWRMDVIETDRQIADGIRRSRQTILTSMTVKMMEAAARRGDRPFLRRRGHGPGRASRAAARGPGNGRVSHQRMQRRAAPGRRFARAIPGRNRKTGDAR